MNWYKQAKRTFQEHIEDVISADLNSPIFITEDYEIIDGAHRTSKAFILNRTIDAIILSQKDLDKALLSPNSNYVGQIYRDDDGDEYSITKLLDLYGKRKTLTVEPKEILKQSKDVWGKSMDVYEVIDKAKKRMSAFNLKTYKISGSPDGYWITNKGETIHCGFWKHAQYAYDNPDTFGIKEIVEKMLNEGHSINAMGDYLVDCAIKNGAIRVNITMNIVDAMVRSKDDFEDKYIEILQIAKRCGISEDKIFKHILNELPKH